jgi:hypothetical protein
MMVGSMNSYTLYITPRCKLVRLEGILKLVTGDGMGEQDHLVICWVFLGFSVGPVQNIFSLTVHFV